MEGRRRVCALGRALAAAEEVTHPMGYFSCPLVKARHASREWVTSWVTSLMSSVGYFLGYLSLRMPFHLKAARFIYLLGVLLSEKKLETDLCVSRKCH